MFLMKNQPFSDFRDIYVQVEHSHAIPDNLQESVHVSLFDIYGYLFSPIFFPQG